MNASHANGCMDTAQKVALCCTTLPLRLIFYKKTLLFGFAEQARAQAARKKSSVGSARQPSLALSKEVDLAAISYVRRAPPTSPLVWARSAMTAKVSLLLNLLSSSCIQFNAEK